MHSVVLGDTPWTAERGFPKSHATQCYSVILSTTLWTTDRGCQRDGCGFKSFPATSVSAATKPCRPGGRLLLPSIDWHPDRHRLKMCGFCVA